MAGTDDLIRGITQVLDAAGKYIEAEEMYEGEAPEIFASTKMRRALGTNGEAFHVNLAKTPVDVVADRLKIAAATVPDEDDVTAVLEEKVWNANQLDLNANDWNHKTLEYGDGLVFVWPTEVDGNGIATDVRIVFNNPITTRMIYDAETGTEEQFAVKLWRVENAYRATLYYADRIERWTTKPGADADPKDASSWEEFTDEDDEVDELGDTVWPIDNPWDEIPMKHLRTATPYGVPEHRHAYGPQNAINKLIVTMMETLDYHAFPQRYALTDPAVENDEDDGIAWPGDDATASSVSAQNKSKFKGGPAELWYMEGVKNVGEFKAAQMAVFLEPAEFFIHLLSAVTTTPMRFFDPTGDAPSGESIRASDAPVTRKTEDRQQRFGPVHSAYMKLALKMLGYPDRNVDIRWAPAATVEDQTGWETVAAKIAAGVPVRAAFLEAGYSAEKLDSWGITEETSDIPMRRQIELLSSLAEATQSLGAGVSFGIFSESDVKAIVNSLVNADKQAA